MIMNKLELKLEYNVCEENCGGVPVIIVAAGSSTRMGNINKQTALISGVPVIARTLMNFENSPYISSIILVTKADDIFGMQLLAEKYNITKVTDIVCGGNSRQESVLKGLERVDKSAEKLLIHDGARPLTDNKIIENVVNALENHSAVTCAVKLKDTVKIINSDGTVESTLDRSALVAVQTPQGVRISDYKAAIEKAGDVSRFTDDMSVMENVGFSVLTVEGNYRNIKITTKEDLKLAEYLLNEENGD